MVRRIVAVVAVGLTLALAAGARAQQAEAPEPAQVTIVETERGAQSALGVGVQSTLTGVYGATVTFWPGRLGLDVTAGGFRGDGDEEGGFAAAVGVLSELLDLGRVRVALGLRGTYQRLRWDGDTHSAYGVELPARLQVRILDRVSAHLEVGLSLRGEHDGGLPGDFDASFAWPWGGAAGVLVYF